jgi:precorrin-2 dehydrogenase / sirohydrochlorin ferrochelatase
MSLLPIFLKLRGRKCLVVGGGSVAESKIESLLLSNAEVTVVAPELTKRVAGLARAGQIAWRQKFFEPSDLDAVFLVIAATNAPEVNHLVYRLAEERLILCNAVDDPEHCHFYYGAVVRRGPLQIAISTDGLSPALAQRLRRELEQQFGPEYEQWVEYLGAMRDLIRASTPDEQRRKEQLHELVKPEAFADFVNSQEHVVAGGRL